MSRSSATTAHCANSGGAGTCTDFSGSCTTVSELQASITSIIRAKNPYKTWAFVADLFGLKERSAKHRLANSRVYTIEELQALLQSEDGLDYLAALMADAEPKWWWWAKQVMAVAAIKRRRAEDEQEILKLETSAPAEVGARRRIKGALDANRNLKASIDRAETSLGLRRPDADRRDADAARAGAGAPHRAVAQAQARRR
ncbi:hypothetical protein [Bradyrhizobium sp. Arg816]|uniref:hypothetical protein n=1 Tax=Bradyrhizobium sp. Arg816 TaxID=2998491 RepID=UPI00249DE4BD|nr:hypothetical protein [Bradyrhizobium sp. Arg816]MDI3563535.1 hypothetical protein [Bradyrhizobium sp. Arg816]